MKTLILSAILVCATSAVAQQKLPCKVADLDAALSEYDKKVTNTSQYLLMDIDLDGVKDIIVRDSDKPSASYAVFLVKDGKLIPENFGYDGYDMLGYGEGGFSFYIHDDHMGMEGRTITTSFDRYQNGKKVMTGGDTCTSSIVGEGEESTYEDETSYTINDKAVSAEEYSKIVPKYHLYSDVKDGWRMVRNNQKVTTYSNEQYDIFDGEIGDYPVTLCFNKGKCDGFYFYKARPENIFTLKCESKVVVDDETNIEVKEYLSDGNSTGTFKGIYIQNFSFSGTFVTQEGKSFDFSLSFKW